MSDDVVFDRLPGSTSAGLIERARRQDGEAWRRLMHLYGPLVSCWCRQRGLHGADAADVVQETFTVVAAALARFDHERRGATFRGWLRTIVQRKIADHYRRQGAQAQGAGGTDAVWRLGQVPEPCEASSAGGAERSDLSSRCRQALENVRLEFEDRTWQAFWRSVIQGHETSQIAADLGISPNAVRQYRSRVLRRLREELGEQAE
jgi:RNA polymerase sigma-70 factor (ECF subfamily)